ncbi:MULTISPECIES: UxaA family hydrolase [unclassified Haloferax]|uniref:UxaA family hydrolase n=1 Tax=unclassified Haloferax TaxID=2625095 RepID=UPI000E284181|nr:MULTISPECIES: UxaA family hydrolase [unclassified Haloferax]RDZ34275.1 galactonate dehydratase [Haloferax sp. Atlit-24N]RLM36023.1 galactonate dehydratase [Haloferax sp. Atlit-109R]RLM41774.1 galactonate dehydratase [Haloferax sp. Atlit-105R]
MRREFTGYRRESGRVGVRNHVAVLPTSVASSCVARGVAAEAGAWARATPHQMGASQPDAARKQTERVLVGVGRNPNVGAALVVEFGTEDIDADDIADRIARDGKPVETLSVREVGGAAAALQRGRTALDSLNEAVADARRESADASELVVGVECGGSDATSGIAANPAVGDACDRLVAAGGTASFSETPEFIGAEHVLAERCADEETRRRLLDRVERREATADLMGVDLRGAQPSPGNQDGGLTTIEEKSLGAISKGGTTPVRGIVDYAERLPVGGGLVLMDTPGYDVESVVGKVAGGAQIIVFTTGRGSTTGNPVAPVVKVTGNPRTWERMRANVDVNAGAVVEGDATIAEAGERVFDEVLAVADGKRTGAETRRMEEFAITEVHPRELAEVRGA